MNPVIFRQYDIRGIVGVDLFVETTYDLACAICSFFYKKNENLKTIIVGMDVRTHSPALYTELVRAFRDSGYDVIDLGVCTTPMLYFATQQAHCVGGVMITASHNPKEYNGFKIVLGSDAIWGAPIQEIKKLYLERASVAAAEQGSHTRYDIGDNYCAWLLQQFPALQNSQMRLAFDCANGATSVIMPKLVEEFGWRNAQLLYAEPDGTFPNHPADPIEMHNMHDLWHRMQHHTITLGIGFDGDGDRMDALDETGFLVPGDQLLAIFTRAIAQEKKKNISMVCDITASAGVVQYAQQHGVSVVMAPCGIGSIKQHMREHNAPIGGELSCHFIFNDERGLGFDDGIYAALRLLEIIVKSGQSLAALRAELPLCVSSPQYRIACKEESKKKLVQSVMESFQQRSDVSLITIDGARVTFPYGWGLVRPSNTLPVMVFRFEASDAARLAQLKKEFADLLAAPLESDLHTLFGL
jgi:phosphomannomutase / phosphoglucomutase